MANFDFIQTKDFRLSLEADASEMATCFKGGAWKSTQVLAGSIVEALLIDYLFTTPNPDRISSKAPLKMDLKEAIDICKLEGAISERAADLCSVIRSYRNLIHPERTARLEETAPDVNSAKVAVALVEMIVADLAKKRVAVVGSTAEQLVSKLRRDAQSMSFFKHLLEEANPTQRDRFLLEIVPSAYVEELTTEFGEQATAERLAAAYRIAFDAAQPEGKKAAMRNFLRVLREDNGTTVELQFKGFFFR